MLKIFIFDFFSLYLFYTSEELVIDFTAIECLSSGHFLLEFSDNFTAEEVNTICQVFTDLSATFNSERTNIPIRISKVDFLPNIYGAATAFWRADNTSGGCGIENNLIWEHINTSANFSDVLQEGYVVGEFQINGQISLESAWHTLDMDANGNFNTPNVQNGFVDLYSVTLHEAMHMLGFYSRILADGSPLNGFYSAWDRHLIDLPPTSPEVHVITPFDDPECCDAHQYNTVELDLPMDLNLGCDNVNQDVFGFKYGETTDDYVTVFGDYLPGSFGDDDVEMINILSHINHDCDGGEYVMHSVFQQDTSRRVLSEKELNILCALGYGVISDGTPVCNRGCSVVALDDFFIFSEDDFEFIQGPLIATITIDYADITVNDFVPEEYEIEIRDCDPFVNLEIVNNPIPQTITITGFLPGRVHNLCYSISGCGYCDEGVINIFRSFDGGIPVPDGLACGNTENIVAAGWGDFEAFIGGSSGVPTNNFFVQTNFQLYDPLGINTGGGVNTPGVSSYYGSNVGYLSGKIAGSTVATTNNESIFLPLSQPIFPGCSITLTLDILTPFFQLEDGYNGSYLEIYGSTLPPSVTPGIADCLNNPNPEDGFQCIVNGITIEEHIGPNDPS